MSAGRGLQSFSAGVVIQARCETLFKNQMKGMREMKMNLNAFMVVIFFLLFLSGSSSAAKLVPANDPRTEYFGRWDKSDPVNYRHSWPGVFIVAVFDGDSVGVRMSDTTNYYDVYVDGRLHSVFHGTASGDADYILADSLVGGRHTLRFSQRNISFGIYSFSGLMISDSASLYQPPPIPLRRIEFIGDSFTAAEGNEATLPEMNWQDKFPVTDIDSGFATMVARNFNADYHITARSGIGTVCDWQGKLDICMPHYFNRTLMESPEPKWDFRNWTPDLVVICLGLNDHSGLRGKDGNVSEKNSKIFQEGYETFLDTLLRVYPGVPILAVSSYEEWIVQNVERVIDEEHAAGHKDIQFASFGFYPGGYVANSHPTVASHKRIAAVIIKAIDDMKVYK